MAFDHLHGVFIYLEEIGEIKKEKCMNNMEY